MKRIIAGLLFAAMLATPSFAQTIEQKITTVLKSDSTDAKIKGIHDLLQTASDTRTAQKAELATGEAKLTDINTQTANYERIVTDHNTRTANLDVRMQSQNDRADRHNANRCTYYDGREQDCAAYNAESNAINAEGAALDQEKASISREKESLDAARAGLQLEIDDYNKWKDDFNSRRDINEDAINKLMNVLAMLQRKNVTCQDVLKNPNSTDEQVKAICGHLFDGNSNHGPLNRTGTGGITPNN
jgi:chromosome segregation ATPase